MSFEIKARSDLLARQNRRLSSQNKSLTSIQVRADSLVSSFVDHATDGYSLAAMVGGGLVYRLGRVGTLALGSRLFGVGAIRESPLLAAMVRYGSIGVGFTGEVFVFEAGQRALRVGIGGADPHLLRWDGKNGLGQGLVGAAITLGSLKGTGFFVQGQNPVLQHLFQDSAMVLAHNVSGTIGIADRPRKSIPEQMVNAEATLWQMKAGTALAHGMAPVLGQAGRSMDLSLREHERELLSTGRDFLLLLPVQGDGKGSEPMSFPSHVLMMSGNGENGKGPKSDFPGTLKRPLWEGLHPHVLVTALEKGQSPARMLSLAIEVERNEILRLRGLALEMKDEAAVSEMKGFGLETLTQAVRSGFDVVPLLRILAEVGGNEGAFDLLAESAYRFSKAGAALHQMAEGGHQQAFAALGRAAKRNLRYVSVLHELAAKGHHDAENGLAEAAQTNPYAADALQKVRESKRRALLKKPTESGPGE